MTLREDKHVSTSIHNPTSQFIRQLGNTGQLHIHI